MPRITAEWPVQSLSTGRPRGHCSLDSRPFQPWFCRSPATPPMEQVPLEEISNATVALCRASAGMTRDELLAQTLEVFGYRRRTAAQVAVLESSPRRVDGGRPACRGSIRPAHGVTLGWSGAAQPPPHDAGVAGRQGYEAVRRSSRSVRWREAPCCGWDRFWEQVVGLRPGRPLDGVEGRLLRDVERRHLWGCVVGDVSQ